MRAGEGSLDLTSTIAEVSAFLAQEPTVIEAPVATHRTPGTQQPLIESLTERELEILHLLAEGHTNHSIADKLILSAGTVKWYSSEIYGKLGVASRTQAVAEARRLQLIAIAMQYEKKTSPESLKILGLFFPVLLSPTLLPRPFGCDRGVGLFGSRGCLCRQGRRRNQHYLQQNE